MQFNNRISVSTHSRPKAAALVVLVFPLHRLGFNTQPPEGGCTSVECSFSSICCFNTQPPEGGCDRWQELETRQTVSTHSRPKAAACDPLRIIKEIHSFNTQPPEGGCFTYIINQPIIHSFNTQPPEGGCPQELQLAWLHAKFQHTAARRRLPHAEH